MILVLLASVVVFFVLGIARGDANAKALYFTSTVYLWFCSTDGGMKSPDCRLADADTYARKALKAGYAVVTDPARWDAQVALIGRSAAWKILRVSSIIFCSSPYMPSPL